MAVQLFKLAMSATTNTTTVPTVNNYFNKLTAQFNGTNLLIPAAKFFKNDGNAATALVTKTSSNGFYLLYINGELQQTALYTVAGTGVTISHTPAIEIPLSAPITLAVTNFAPVSSTVVTG